MSSLASRTQFCMGVAALLYGANAAARPEKLPRLAIEFAANSTPSAECQKLSRSISSHVSKEERFEVVKDGSFQLKLELDCESDQVVGTVGVKLESGDVLSAAELSMTTETLHAGGEGIAANFWRQLTHRLPWMGEMYAVEKWRSANRSLIKGLKVDATAKVTSGTNANALLGACVPLEVGAPAIHKKTGLVGFRVNGWAILREVQLNSGRLDVYFRDKSADLAKFYVTRLADPVTVPKAIQNRIKECQEYGDDGLEEGRIFGGLTRILGKDPVEVNNIQQRFGAMYLKFSASNGEDGRGLLSGSMANRLFFGEHFFIDFMALRSVVSKYEYKKLGVGTEPLDPPEVTLANIFGGLRGKVGDFSLLFGLGTLVEKTNIPYVKKDESGNDARDVRSASIRTAGVFGANYQAGRFNVGARIPMALVGSRHIEGHTYLQYRLSSTWITGIDAMVLRSEAKVAGAPSMTAYGVGAHLGVEIGR